MYFLSCVKFLRIKKSMILNKAMEKGGDEKCGGQAGFLHTNETCPP